MKTPLKRSFFFRYFAVCGLILLIAGGTGFFISGRIVERAKAENEIDHLMRAARVFEAVARQRGETESSLARRLHEEYPGFVPKELFFISADGRPFAQIPWPRHLELRQIIRELPTEPMIPRRHASDDNLVSVRLPSGDYLLRLIKPWHQKGNPALKPEERDAHRGGVQIKHPRVWGMTPEGANALIFVVALALGFLLCIFVCFRLFRTTAQAADRVLSELQSGNLKARFDVGQVDRYGLMAVKFNQMADEIENLVEALKQSENARKEFLQGLAHDLKTPVASLIGLLESIREHRSQMEERQIDEFLDGSLAETRYFERLVSDLLFVSGVNDSRYGAKVERIDLMELIREEAALISASGVQVEVRSRGPAPVHGDPHLLKRLLRNGLDNAASFARRRVAVDVDADEGRWIVRIEDDGPGLSENEIRSFGERSFSRKVSTVRPGRISIGLGSVIMKKIAGLHGGGIRIENRHAQEVILGARLSIHLPKATASFVSI